MSFRWSEETTLKFVSNYVEHECLWNVKSPHYKNKQMKQSAYSELEKAMDIPGFGEREIKLKIKNIRSTYSQELKKIKDSKNSGAGTDTVYIPSIKWFGILDASLRNLNSMLTQSESNLASNISNTDDTDIEQNEPTPPPPPPTKKKRIAQLSSMVSQLKEISNTTNSTVEENEFEVFGKHVGLQLKALPLLLALEAQEHIQLYLNKTRRQHLQNGPQSSYATTESPYSESSINTNNNETSNFSLEPFSSSILPTHHSEHVADYQFCSNMLPSGRINNNKPLSNVKIISNDLIFTAMQNADVDK